MFVRNRRLAALAGCVVVLITAVVVGRGTREGGRSSIDVSDPRALPGTNIPGTGAGASPAILPGVGVRAASTAALRIAHRKPRDVERLLYEIEARAREQGEVMPADVNEGMEAIAELSSVMGRQQLENRKRDFGRRMSLLTRELRIAPMQRELEDMATRAGAIRDHDARARLIAEVRARAEELPAIERAKALAQLEHAVGPAALTD